MTDEEMKLLCDFCAEEVPAHWIVECGCGAEMCEVCFESHVTECEEC